MSERVVLGLATYDAGNSFVGLAQQGRRAQRV